MNTKSVGLACLASLVAPSAMALETELAIAERDSVNAGVALENKHWSNGAIRDGDVTSHGFLDARYWDVGVHLDGWMAMVGDDGNASPKKVSTFESTDFTGRLDYLFEVQDILQILPFVQSTVYPNITGRTPFNWLGTDVWFMLPWEGIELGGSAQYNLFDGTTSGNSGPSDHHWLFTIGAREMWQDAPLDLLFWQTADLSNRSYHRVTVGDNNQGITTINVGGKATLPLPYEELWAFLSVEGHWYVTKDDRHAVEATPGRDASEVIIGIGIEYRSE